MDQPPTKYARSGELSIAYQVLGDGPMDLVHVPGFVSNLADRWEDPAAVKFFSRMVPQVPTLEERIDDMRAVMAAVRSDRAALFGISEGGPMALLYAATYPDRVPTWC